jgi:cell division protein FtsI (penicillin-binding protein 3)
MDVREINRKLASENATSSIVKRQLPPDVADRVSALKLPGIHQKNEYRRYYPAGEVMAHMLGFTGVEDSGQEGIELAFDASCRASPAAGA